ncbi:MAG: S9 family peptidase [Flavobacteriia bacterium]|nr:S9 family peptidase [Flavobacteriia bacterium]
MKYVSALCISLLSLVLYAQEELTLQEMMKGQDFTGYWPEAPQWNIDGSAIYFHWNKDGKKEAEPYKYVLKSKEMKEISVLEMRDFIPLDKTQLKYKNQVSLVQESLVLTDRFQSGLDFYKLTFNTQGMKQIVQLTNYGAPKSPEKTDSTYLERQQMELFTYFKDHLKEKDTLGKSNFQRVQETPLPVPFESISGCFFHPHSGVVLLRVEDQVTENSTMVPNYITPSGQTTTFMARAKVSSEDPHQRMYLHVLGKDSLIPLDFSKLTNIRSKPAYMDTTGGILFTKDRSIFIHDPVFAKKKPLALLDIRAADNKDRWIVAVDLKNGKVRQIEHQHDDAWIGGPGISEWNMENGTLGFVQNDDVVFFQSEENGFSQLYELDLTTSKKRLVYPGGQDFEMQSVDLTQDENGYFVSHNLGNPRCMQFSTLHRIHQKLTHLISNNLGGIKNAAVSPDEKNIAYLGSTATEPWEIYLKLGNEKPLRITHSSTQKFKNFSWKCPEFVTFRASDGKEVYARLYTPDSSQKNGAAVCFVHGAGYLQNAHTWWSQYYREFMFHQWLARKGYTVIDIDYRASAGYGRDYRTAIYIYGGSYGGFVTLMSLFQHPDAFACGAALRSVTDWAHYNHEYTSNILNYPDTDPKAYRASSPIYYAEGLKKPLLILHGMVDDNVQYQDVVRLQQRLIELGKTNWELASYPVESHGFKEAYSWYDEYQRIYALFERYLLK